jgi:prevent-host-death family protein
MRVSVSEAKGQLTDLVRRAEAGDDVVLTRHGQDIVRLTPLRRALSTAERRAVLERFQREASARILPGPDAARSQDFLYDEDGLPG